jgi:prepilin peptidase CpaA
VYYLIPVIAAGLFLIIGYSDIRTRRIPNRLAFAVAALGLARLILAGDAAAAVISIGVAAVAFMVGFLLFWRGLLGGGDVKLFSAAVLLVGAPSLSLFLVAMSLCGLVVTLATVAADRLARRPAVSQSSLPEPRSRRTVPYGVAIAGGAVLTLAVQLPHSW